MARFRVLVSLKKSRRINCAFFIFHSCFGKLFALFCILLFISIFCNLSFVNDDWWADHLNRKRLTAAFPENTMGKRKTMEEKKEEEIRHDSSIDHQIFPKISLDISKAQKNFTFCWTFLQSSTANRSITGKYKYKQKYK